MRRAATAAFVVSLVLSPVDASADEHRLTDPGPPMRVSEPECRPDDTNQQPCHVTRRETFERLPKNHPVLGDDHARDDYLRFYRQQEACKRNPADAGCRNGPDHM